MLLLERLGIMTFSKSVSSVRLLVMLQILVLMPCLPGLKTGGVVKDWLCTH